MKKYFVRDLKKSIGLMGESVFVLKKKESRMTKSQKPYLDVTLADRTGEIQGKVWADNLTNASKAVAGDVVLVDFRVQEYNGKIDLVVNRMTVTDDYDSADLATIPDGLNVEDLKLQLSKRIDSVRDFHLRQIIDLFFDDEEFYERYTTYPAAMRNHHEYRHGLLQHSLEVAAITETYIKMYPTANRDLLTTGALLHDMGKIYEYAIDELGVVSVTFEGRMVGHIALGVEMLTKKLPKDFPLPLKHQLLHLILSHHGSLEFGSPMMPSTREALILHYADKSSAEQNFVDTQIKLGLEASSADGFTDYLPMVKTRMFLGDLAEDE